MTDSHDRKEQFSPYVSPKMRLASTALELLARQPVEIPEEIQARIEQEAIDLAAGEDDPELREYVRAIALKILEDRERGVRAPAERIRARRALVS